MYVTNKRPEDHDLKPARLRFARVSIVLACLAALSGCAGMRYNHHGKSLLSDGNTTEGVAALKDAVKIEPREPGYAMDYLRERDRAAEELNRKGVAALAAGDLKSAREAFEKILEIDSSNAVARASIARTQRVVRHQERLQAAQKLFEADDLDGVDEILALILSEDAGSAKAVALREKVADKRSSLEVKKILDSRKASILNKTVSLQLRDATLRAMMDAISKTTGLNVMFDREVKQDTKATLFVTDVPVIDAIDLGLMQHGLDRRMINDNTMVIFPNTAAKAAEYQPLQLRSFMITNADPKYVLGLLKGMLKVKDASLDEKTGLLVLRDTGEILSVAEKLIKLHDVPDAEVMLEVQVLEVSNTRNQTIGVRAPDSFTLAVPQGVNTLGALRDITSGALTVSALSTTLNLKLQDGSAKLLASPRIRAKNKEKAKIMIGDRVPTITNTVTPVNSGSSVVTGNVSYQDVGLKLEFEPAVFANDDVGIKINLEVSNIAQEFTDANGSRSYQIGTRNASTVLRLKDGETQVLGGLINDQDRGTASKIPGVGHLPMIGRLFGSNESTSVQSEIILSITPRIVRSVPAVDTELKSIHTGTAQLFRDRRLLDGAKGKVEMGGAVMSPGTGGPSNTGGTGSAGFVGGAGAPAAPGSSLGGGATPYKPLNGSPQPPGASAIQNRGGVQVYGAPNAPGTPIPGR